MKSIRTNYVNETYSVAVCLRAQLLGSDLKMKNKKGSVKVRKFYDEKIIETSVQVEGLVHF